MPAPTTDGGTIPVAHYENSGLDFAALALMAPAFGLEANQNFFEKLRVFEGECLRAWRGLRPDRCTGQHKANCRYRFGEFLEWACKQCNRK